jgi:hypothetical protein
MWRRVDLVLTGVSEERIASIFRVENPRTRNQREQMAADSVSLLIIRIESIELENVIFSIF